MKALLVCPTCGYQMVGCDPQADEALKAAYAGILRHQEVEHAIPMQADRMRALLREGQRQ